MLYKGKPAMVLVLFYFPTLMLTSYGGRTQNLIIIIIIVVAIAISVRMMI